MFETLKIYTHKVISMHEIKETLVRFGYQGVREVAEEGDFATRGDVLEVFCANFNFPLRLEWQFDRVDKIYSFDKVIGRKIIDYDFIIILPFKKKARRYSEDIPLDIVLKIKKRDYVVHSRYGIGKFLGTKRLKTKETWGYFFEIEYANKDKLYVPKEEAHLVQKYVSLTTKPPRLSRLGSKEWQNTKARAEKGIKAFALELLKLEAQRKLTGGIRAAADTDWQKAFEESFPYQETEDQIRATVEVKKDMESEACLDRLICGDVGYGKTEVAMRTAFKAVMNEKQVAFLVPTTVLAYQHYANLTKRLGDFPVVVEMLSRLRKASQMQDIMKRLAKGAIDIVVGTHRLLSEDIAFNDLGLLIVDDEQKFGVTHKERLKKLKSGIDVLTLTATPIPRTLYMSIVGIKNISLIKTPPQARLAVKTKVEEFSSGLIKEAIRRELKRQGQIYFVHNRIESIHRIEKLLKKELPELRFGIIHGRMPARFIEKVMFDFIEKRLDCLLSTAIVESGIDIPNANTIIVNDAHTFGLSDLHQLRGRVGRFNIQAHAYFLIPRFSTLSSEAKKRLDLLEEFSHLGSGFELAMFDLEMRGAGNILGREQHGFVWMVGFDLYCRLLKKEIEYLKDTFGDNHH